MSEISAEQKLNDQYGDLAVKIGDLICRNHLNDMKIEAYLKQVEKVNAVAEAMIAHTAILESTAKKATEASAS